MDNQEQNSVYYCCVAKRNRVIYVYSREDQQLESMAAMSLERAPPLHIWYTETVGRLTFGFLSENEYTYFAIVDKNLHNAKLLRFLEHMREEFKKASTKKLRNSFSFSNKSLLHEELVPAIKRLIASLENISHIEEQDGNAMANGASDPCTSTKAPLLGKPSRHEKKKTKERSCEGRGANAIEENGNIKIDIDNNEASNQGGVSSMSLQKSLSSGRVRGQQVARRVWWRHVWIVLTIDVLVCLILFGIWLGVCQGFKCLTS